MSRFSNLLFNFAEDFLMASLQISAYWSSESEIFMYIFMAWYTIKLLIFDDLTNFI